MLKYASIKNYASVIIQICMERHVNDLNMSVCTDLFQCYRDAVMKYKNKEKTKAGQQSCRFLLRILYVFLLY